MKGLNIILIIFLFSTLGNSQSRVDKNIEKYNEVELDSIAKVLSNRDEIDILEIQALLEQSISLGFNVGVAKYNALLGDHFSTINAVSDAEKYYLDGLEAIRNCKNETKLEILAIGNLSSLYSGAMDLDKAYEFTIQLLKKAEEYGDSSLISYAYYNYGYMYNAVLDFESELKYYLLALNYLTNQNEYSVRRPVLHSEIASIYHSLNVLDSAEYHFFVADSLFKEDLKEGIEYNYEYASLDLYIGQFLLADNMLDSALIRCQSAYDYFKSINSKYNEINCALCLLESYEARSDTQKINQYYHEIKSLALLIDDPYINYLIADYKFREIEKDIAPIHLPIIKDYLKHKDSLNVTETQTKVLKKENQLKLTIKQQELLLSKKQLQTEKRIKYLYLFLFIISLGGLLLIWRYLNIENKLHKKTKEQHQNQKLIQKSELKNKEAKLALAKKEKELLAQKLSNSERTLILKSMMRKDFTNLLKDLNSKLESIGLNESSTSNKALNSAFNMIKSFERLGQTDEEFMTHFDNIHPQFYTRLKKKHPNLSLNDQKLSAYIKMNMSTKEVSKLLNITPSSVNTSRYRLRIKLDLSKDDDLNSYIHSI